MRAQRSTEQRWRINENDIQVELKTEASLLFSLTFGIFISLLTFCLKKNKTSLHIERSNLTKRHTCKSSYICLCGDVKGHNKLPIPLY